MAAFQGHDTTGDEPFAPGDRVYAEDGDGWRLATVQSLAGHSITLDDGSECAIDELLRWNEELNGYEPIDPVEGDPNLARMGSAKTV